MHPCPAVRHPSRSLSARLRWTLFAPLMLLAMSQAAFADREFRKLGVGRGLDANWVYPLHLGPSKRLWVGTVGGGVDRWDESTGGFEHFSLANLLSGPAEYDFIYALHEAADGRLWVGTRLGLVVLQPGSRAAAKVDLATVPEGEIPLVTSIYSDRN